MSADMGYQIDNMEAMDVWQRPDGAIMVSLIVRRQPFDAAAQPLPRIPHARGLSGLAKDTAFCRLLSAPSPDRSPPAR
jgi:hypothetical protein